MDLRSFLRRHRNVFSPDPPEVEIGRGEQDAMSEEYGDRFDEKRIATGRGTGVLGWRGQTGAGGSVIRQDGQGIDEADGSSDP